MNIVVKAMIDSVDQEEVALEAVERYISTLSF
jgi:hypothetical protein